MNQSTQVYFFCCPDGIPGSKKTVYQHTIVCLAEGLKALGIPFYADRNFWRTSPNYNKYLFNFDPYVTPDDCSVVVLHNAWFTACNEMPLNLFHSQRRYTTVFFESEADSKYGFQAEFRNFDFIFRTHYNCRFRYPANYRPWAFGLTNRILQSTKPSLAYSDRKPCMLVNFRLWHPIREYLEQNFLPLVHPILPADKSVDLYQNAPKDDPYAYLAWLQTDRRHYPQYYQRLRESKACACFGGVLINPWPSNAFGPSTLHDRLLNKLLSFFDTRPRRLMNWESWRMWEAIASGCVAFHLDLDKYGATLPVMPTNWRHYVGVDLENLQAAADRLIHQPTVLETISVEGRKWALKYYSPIPTALRFLETIQK